jgi:diadenosine tetraphosphate (Ap4A) HIT family hydrolase
MGRSRGLEPPTLGTTNRCSNQLSYDRLRNASQATLSSGFLWRGGHLGSDAFERKLSGAAMNPTVEKFGFPGTLLKEFEHWVVLLRPAQVTLGSLVLAAKSDATAYANLSREAFAEQADAVRAIEGALARFTAYERLNCLMLMMVDPNVHFHVIPRYSEPRTWDSIEFTDAGWPGLPRLEAAVKLDPKQLKLLATEVGTYFR